MELVSRVAPCLLAMVLVGGVSVAQAAESSVKPTQSSAPSASATLLPILPATTQPAASTATPQAAVTQPLKPISVQALVDLAKQATLSAFTYDYQNYANKLHETEQFFTNAGWKAYSHALEQSNNIKTVMHGSMIVSAALAGQPRLLRQHFFNGERAWQIQVPVRVLYQGKAQHVQQNLDVEVTIVPVADQLNKEIAVEQFVAKPATMPS